MSLSVEAVIADAQKLVLRLKEHDTSAECLISRTQALHKQLDAMKQFQDYLNQLNEVARHRPRIGVIITLAQENSKIRELQQENQELRQSLEEHESALELIMAKYREQVSKLTKANSIERHLLQQSQDETQDLEAKSDKVTEMAAVMTHAAGMDNSTLKSAERRRLMEELEFENRIMRQMLQIDGNGDSSCHLSEELAQHRSQLNKAAAAAAAADDVTAVANLLKIDTEIQTDETEESRECSPLSSSGYSTLLRRPKPSSASPDDSRNSVVSEELSTSAAHVEIPTPAASVGADAVVDASANTSSGSVVVDDAAADEQSHSSVNSSPVTGQSDVTSSTAGDDNVAETNAVVDAVKAENSSETPDTGV